MHLHRGNLFLVGMPGSGKSTLGRLLAKRLGKAFYDADSELERRLGVSIPVIFELEGEPGFRDRSAAPGQPRLPEAERIGALPPRNAGNAVGTHQAQQASAVAAGSRSI
jgi:hypothetical protein